MSKYKGRNVPVSRNTDTRHKIITDGDIFLPDWEKIEEYDPMIIGVIDLRNRRSSGLSCVLEFRWDNARPRDEWWMATDGAKEYAKLFAVRDDGKRLKSNIFWEGRCSNVWTHLFEFLIKYDPKARFKKINKIERGW